MGGPLLPRLGSAEQYGTVILPVDSEHSAVFQALQAGRREEVRQGSAYQPAGALFVTYSSQQLAQVTVADALAHPTWEHGAENNGRFGNA